MELELAQIDAFTQEIFGGNSAAVVVLDDWLDDSLLQLIARENNLSETAYVVPHQDHFHIRWFTPTVEVDLCGHATLAAGFELFNRNLVEGDEVQFKSAADILKVTREGDMLQLDFPARTGEKIEDSRPLEDALGVKVQAAYQSRDTLVILENQSQVAAFEPDLAAISKLDTYAVMVSAPGDDCDFVSRFFAPAAGINEDPVTGSAHCTLVPYWANALGKNKLHAKQLSARQGELFCEMVGERVKIAGYCREYLRGTIQVA